MSRKATFWVKTTHFKAKRRHESFEPIQDKPNRALKIPGLVFHGCPRGRVERWTSTLVNSTQLGWSWVSFGHPLGSSWLELDRVSGLNLIKLKFSPNSSQVFHRLATSANSSQVILKKIEWFSCQLARLGSSVWPLADARFDFVN